MNANVLDLSPQAEKTQIKPKAHISALDGIRGLAVLLVFLDHYGDLTQHAHSTVLVLMQRIKSTGYIGVDIFFALSGYLITGILWKTKHDEHRVRNFYAKRALRLFPVYYGVWIFLLLYSAITGAGWNPVAFLEYLFYWGIWRHSITASSVHFLWAIFGPSR